MLEIFEKMLLLTFLGWAACPTLYTLHVVYELGKKEQPHPADYRKARAEIRDAWRYFTKELPLMPFHGGRRILKTAFTGVTRIFEKGKR